MGSLTCLLILGIASPVWAGYRVHKLRIDHYDEAGKVVAKEQVLSTLDPVQYEHHNGGYRVMRVWLEDTWYCPGDTSRRQYCPKPKLAPTRGPASTDPKRIAPYNLAPVRP